MNYSHVSQADRVPGPANTIADRSPESRGERLPVTNEAAHQRPTAVEVARTEAEAVRLFQRLELMDKIRNVIVWCMAWALIEGGISVALTDHRLGWRFLVHLIGLIGLYLVFKWPFARA
jgi:hypothetical protein